MEGPLGLWNFPLLSKVAQGFEGARLGMMGEKEPWEMTREEFEMQPNIFFHGSPNPNLTKLSEGAGGEYQRVAGIYLTKDKKEALKYTKINGKTNPSNIYVVQVKYNNPARRSDLDKIGYGKSGFETRKLLQEMGYDFLIDDLMREAVAFNPDQTEIVSHRNMVTRALDEGRPVSPKVMDDYPDLKR